MAEATTARNPYTRRIAEFVSQLKYEHVSAEVRDRLKLLILDSLGCAIYGADLKWCRIIRETLERVDKTRTTGIWGTDRQLSSVHAALVNGTQVQSFELDDVHRLARVHLHVEPNAIRHDDRVGSDVSEAGRRKLLEQIR